MENEKVKLNIWNLEKVFQIPLLIPAYQRIYCWDKDILLQLLDDLLDRQNISNYRLGSLILNK